jgi:phosphoadenosine phosphosulfate reductase
VRSQLDVDLRVVAPSITRSELTGILGKRPWETDPDRCCHYMKIEPLTKFIHEKDAWLSAVRRDQSPTRAKIDIVEVDERDVIKIYPLADWASEQAWSHIRAHDLPYNPLHDKSYMSVGCSHCTKPVRAGQHERAGRWGSSTKLECGIHAFPGSNSNKPR